MLYECIPVKMCNDGSLVAGKRKQCIIWKPGLEVGGLYYLRPGRLYRVVSARQEEKLEEPGTRPSRSLRPAQER